MAARFSESAPGPFTLMQHCGVTLTVSVGKEWKKHQITVGFEVSQL